MNFLFSYAKGSYTYKTITEPDKRLIFQEVDARLKALLLVCDQINVSVGELLGNCAFFAFHSNPVQADKLASLYRDGTIRAVVYHDPGLDDRRLILDLPDKREKQGTVSHLSPYEEKLHAGFLANSEIRSERLPPEQQMRPLYLENWKRRIMPSDVADSCPQEITKKALLRLKAFLNNAEPLTLSDMYKQIESATPDLALQRLLKKYFKFLSTSLNAEKTSSGGWYDESHFYFNHWDDSFTRSCQHVHQDSGMQDSRFSKIWLLRIASSLSFADAVEARRTREFVVLRRALWDKDITLPTFLNIAEKAARIVDAPPLHESKITLSDLKNGADVASIFTLNPIGIAKGVIGAGQIIQRLIAIDPSESDFSRCVEELYRKKHQIVGGIASNLCLSENVW